jgi:uncharacterized coiled-coil protein SlyX
MKTISRIILVLALLIACFSTDSVAQSSPLTDLQATETALNSAIAATQADITTTQSQLATVASDITAATDAGEEEYALGLAARETDLNASLAALQATLAQQQAELADIQSKITATQDEINQNDKNWWLANTPPETPHAAPSPINAVPDPNNPASFNIIFGSTGNAAQDAQLIRSWLFQYGLIDSEF